VEGLDQGKLLSLYETMLRIRRFEETVAKLFYGGEIPGFVHLYIGEEAIATGVIHALRRDDYITSTHRGHGHLIAKGVDLKKLMAELYGKETGLNKGRGGSMHAVDVGIGVMGANGIVGSGIGLAAGVALAVKYRGKDNVVAAFFGDGASNTGVFHETLNMASIWKLPVLFVCENNMYAATVPVKKSLSVDRVSKRASAYNIEGVTVDGTNVLEVYETAEKLVKEIRGGRGPALLEALTLRVRGHFEGDPQHYRPKDEVDEFLRERDPIVKFRNYLISNGFLNEVMDSEIRSKVEKEVLEAVEFARNSPYPKPDTALEYTYSESKLTYKEPPPGSRVITYVEAVREALDYEMSRYDDVIVLGEDVVAAGVWGVTKGLAAKYGADVRVIDTPISEDGFTLMAVGAAMAGLRVVVEHRFADFLYLAMNAIFNHAAKLRYMSGGQFRIPILVRAAIGAGISAAAQHSSTNASMFVNHPGLKVVAPATPYDAKGLFLASIRDGNPVVFLEHKKLYRMSGPVPEEEYVIPLGKASVKKEGNDVTIVTYSYMLHESLEAAKELKERYGIDAEVIDLRTLYPLDRKTLRESVEKTMKLVVVDEGWGPCGISSEVIATVEEEAFGYLDSRPVRINTGHAPIPFSPPLEKEILPSKEKIVRSILTLFRR
jgi:2-oxoisovalerate dehydrogenase E1 component